MSGNQAPTALSDDDLALITGGKGTAGAPDVAAALAGGANLQEIMAAVMTERANLLDQQFKSVLAEIGERNTQINHLNQGLDVLTNVQKDLSAQGSNGAVSLAASVVFEGKTTTLGEVAKALELPSNALQDGQLSKEELQSGIHSVKSQRDTENEQQQLDMVRMQLLQDKRDQAVAQLDAFIKKPGGK